MEVVPVIDSDEFLSFSSSQLQELPVGRYEIELWVVNQAGTSIYPSQGYLSFTINENSIGFNGEAIPTITLHEFEERIDKLEKDLRAKADNGDFDGEKGEPGDKGDPGKDATNNDPNAVHVSGNQAISGVKNFIDTPTINGNKVLDDSLQIGGRNLLLDSATQSSSAWAVKNDNNSGEKYLDSLSYKATSAWNAPKHSYSNLLNRGVIDYDKDYTFSVMLKASNDLQSQGNLYFYLGASNKNNSQMIHVNDIPNHWIQVSVTFRLDKNSEKENDAISATMTTGCDSGYVLIAGYKLEQGTKATDWTPAPEDIGTSQPIMSGNYGLRVTADGFQKTTDGGATWTTADI